VKRQRSRCWIAWRALPALVVALSALAVACGGGGGSSATPQPSVPCSVGPAAAPSPAPGSIATIAGKCNGGSGENNIAALDAQLYTPSGLALDKAGNLYLGDYGSSTVRKIGLDRKISVVAGTDAQSGSAGDGGAALAAQLNDPTSVALDNSGNLYVVDSANNRIRKVGTDGTISTVAGNGQEGFSGDGGKATTASFDHLRGLAVDSGGNLYVVDAYNYVVRKVAVDGTLTTVAGNGHAGFAGDGGPATAAEFKDPVGIAVDRAGDLYISDNGDCRVRRVSPAGVISTFAGDGENRFSGEGGQATTASLCPGALALDGKGNLYVVDVANLRVRRIAADGTITTAAGNGAAGASGDGGPAALARLNVGIEAAIALDGQGNLYIADNNSNLVREVFAP
jgi:trimeric autotransporter adhesin